MSNVGEMFNSIIDVSTIDQIIIDWFNGLFNANGWGNFLLIIASLLMATLLSSIIGFEREYHGHAAGLRTHILVALGSALIAVVSLYGFGDELATRDPARLVAQVVSGIGFLGAGTIIQTGTDVKGLTTATTLWFVMTIGIASGLGRFAIAIIATIIALVVLICLRRIETITANKMSKIIMLIDGEKPILKEIMMISNNYGLRIKDIQTQVVINNGKSCLRITISYENTSASLIKALAEELRTLLAPLEITVAKP